MKHKYQYFNDSDRENIINANTDKFLVEEQNLTEGNFLVFSETQEATAPVFVSVELSVLQDLQKQIDELKVKIE